MAAALTPSPAMATTRPFVLDAAFGFDGVLGGTEVAGQVERPVLEEPFPSVDDGPSVDDTLDAEAFGVGEGLDGGQLDAPGPV